MSVTTILAARGREMVNTRARTPEPSKVEAAIETVQLEIIRLRRLQQDIARREARAERLRAARSEMTAEANRKAQARMALRAETFAIDKKWFMTHVNEVADDLREQAREARMAGQSMRADYLSNRVEALGREVDKILERERLFGSANNA